MNTYILYTLIGLGIILMLWSLAAYIAIRSLEEPKYTVEAVKDGYEVRAYAPTLAATTTVGGADFDGAINEGFRRIADYIFGNNTMKTSIAMTVPVQESEESVGSAEGKGSSASIAMTVPVLEQGSSTQRIISFIMPSKYTKETIPQPNNPAVVLVENPARRMAVLRFGWFAGAERVAAKKNELAAMLTRDGVQMVQEPMVAFYNPPFTPPFMRRNEVLVEIAP
jgi:hypothetical protein